MAENKAARDGIEPPTLSALGATKRNHGSFGFAHNGLWKICPFTTTEIRRCRLEHVAHNDRRERYGVYRE
jgi:hypothetical protein